MKTSVILGGLLLAVVCVVDARAQDSIAQKTEEAPTPVEATQQSPVELFEADLRYRAANIAKKMVCYASYAVSYEKRGGFPLKRGKLMHDAGSLQLENETTEMRADRNLSFVNFTVDFSDMRKFTLRTNGEVPHPLLDVIMAPYYQQGSILGVSASFLLVKGNAKGASMRERMLDLESSYSSQPEVKVLAMRGTDFSLVIRDNEAGDPVTVRLECYLK